MKREFLVVICLSFFSVLILQIACFPALAHYTIFRPHFLLVLMILAAVGRTPFPPELTGFLFGFILDLFSSTRTGTNALLFTVIGYTAGITARKIPASSFFLFLGYVFFFSLFYFVLSSILGGLTNQVLGGDSFAFFSFVLSNLMAAPLFYFFLRRVFRLPQDTAFSLST